MKTSRQALEILTKTLILFLLSLIPFLPLLAYAQNKTIVVFPFAVYADKPSEHLRQGVRSMLASRLSGGGIDVIGDEGLEFLLREKEEITSEERAEELARGLEADYALFGSITTIGGGYSVDLSLLELGKDRSRLTRVSETVDEDQFIPRLSDLAYRVRAVIEGKEETVRKMEELPRVAQEPQVVKKDVISKLEPDKREPEVGERQLQDLKPAGRISVSMAVMAFDMGDLDGDGEAELAILGRKRLLVYKRQGESFALRDTLKAGFGEDFLKVSAGDADNNGMAEIYLASRKGIQARSSVLGWTGGFKRLDRLRGHLQVVREPGGGKPLLLFQGSTAGEFFSGGIYVMDYDKGGKLTKKQQLPELKRAQFYTLAVFDLDGDGDSEFLGLGEFSRLHVWDKEGDVLWSSGKKIGGTNNAIVLGDAPPLEAPPRIPFNGRLVIADIDGDGKKEILAIENIPLVEHLTHFKLYKKSSLIAYRAEGTSLFEAWTSKEIDYCLTDMQADAKGLFLAAQKGKATHIGRGSGVIMWFE